MPLIIMDVVQSVINADSVVIFTRRSDPNCKLAKEVFDKLKRRYSIFELDNRFDEVEILDYLEETTGSRILPRVFVGGICIGNEKDCEAAFQNGELIRHFHYIKHNILYLRPKERFVRPSIKDYVEKIIVKNTVVIFSWSNCPSTRMAKVIFNELNQPYKAIELDSLASGYEIKDYLEEMSGGNSLPRVFVGTLYIGNGEDCKELFKSGELSGQLYCVKNNLPYFNQKQRLNRSYIKNFVEHIVLRNTVVIFAISDCPSTQMAKEIFDKLKQSYVEIKLDRLGYGYGSKILDYFVEMTGRNDLPRVFINALHIGAGTECKSMYESGQLRETLLAVQ